MTPPVRISVGTITSINGLLKVSSERSLRTRDTKFVSLCSSIRESGFSAIKASPELSSSKNLAAGSSIRKYPVSSSSMNGKKLSSNIDFGTEDATVTCIFGTEVISYVPNIFVPAGCKRFCTTSRYLSTRTDDFIAYENS